MDQNQNDEIIFLGTRKINKIQNLVFNIRRANETKSIVIPIDEKVAAHILRYLEKFGRIIPKPVERGNDNDVL